MTNLIEHLTNMLSPEQYRLVTLRQPTPWTSADIKPDKQNRRWQWTWRITQLQVEYDAFKRKGNRVNATLNTFRIQYCYDLLRMNANNPNSLFKTINRAPHRTAETPIPQHESEVDFNHQ